MSLRKKKKIIVKVTFSFTNILSWNINPKREFFSSYSFLKKSFLASENRYSIRTHNFFKLKVKKKSDFIIALFFLKPKTKCTLTPLPVALLRNLRTAITTFTPKNFRTTVIPKIKIAATTTAHLCCSTAHRPPPPRGPAPSSPPSSPSCSSSSPWSASPHHRSCANPFPT